RPYQSPVAMETLLRALKPPPLAARPGRDGGAQAGGGGGETSRSRLRGGGQGGAVLGTGGAALGDFLSRFLWRRRLLIVSAASGEDAAYEQQLHALQGQGCSLGRRLIVVLKLLGLDDQAGGIMEGHGLSGNVSVETEAMSAHLVSEVRSYFRLSPEVYGSVLVESDGVPLAWFPAPVVAVALLYELLDGGHGGGGGQAEWGLPPCPEHDHNYGYYGHYPQHGGHRY
ncbi:coiled-coil domain-containing protein 80-like, partial [Lampetra fluviatilis]